MEHLPQIVIDLALLLTVAGIATVICKKLKQPLVLGYIVAGFLVGPATGLLPSVIDTSEISVWADIGIIFLMFGLGLEFSIIRLTRVGKSAITTALIEMLLMITAGFMCGIALGWNTMNAVFLGGMLAISSTTIIIKTFEDLGLQNKKFTSLVFGTLVIEDIVGIFLMVLLSTVAVSSNVSGGEVASQIGSMALYLIVWFVLSIILVPTLFKKVAGFITDEIMLTVSVALCLIMVVLADVIGFSSALGAFLAGSILAGTVQISRIKTLFKPLRNLFGAIFFVSVGLLVTPAMIAEHILPIIVITLLTLILKPLFSTLGALVSGQSLRTSLQTGTSLLQIGEFSFIIAGLGVTFGVTSDFLYPIIVTVSVITALTTPFYIKNSDKVYHFVKRILPDGLLERIDAKSQKTKEKPLLSPWKDFVKQQLVNSLLVAFVAIASIVLGLQAITFLSGSVDSDPLRLTITIIALIIVCFFISNLYVGTRSSSFAALWLDKKNYVPLSALFLLTLAISFVSLGAVASILGRFGPFLIVFVSLVLVIAFSQTALAKTFNTWFIEIKTRFIANLKEQELEETFCGQCYDDMEQWIERTLYVISIRLKAHRVDDPKITFSDKGLFLGQIFNLDLLRVEEDTEKADDFTIPNVPSARPKGQKKTRKQELAFSAQDTPEFGSGAVLSFLGTEYDIHTFVSNDIKEDVFDRTKSNVISLHDFLARESEQKDDPLVCMAATIETDSKLRGKRVGRSGLQESFNCIVIAIARGSLPILKPSSSYTLEKGDTVWVIGSKGSLENLDEQGYLKLNNDAD